MQPAEVDRLVKLVEKSQKLGDNFEASVKTALLAVLCSKSFLYLEEGHAAGPVAATRPIGNWPRGCRISCGARCPTSGCSTWPATGKLHRAETLRAEVRRMLADPKAAAFAESFPRQWLQLRKVGMFAPDKVLYPDYDEYLEKSMIAETTGFFREVLTRNASLARVPRFRLDDAQRTPGRRTTASRASRARRCGASPSSPKIIAAACSRRPSILSLTSDGTRHRPVHRGVWVLESIIGKPPPPPPANVPALNTPPANAPKDHGAREAGTAPLRRRTAPPAIRKIDPLGLAFDNYDAIGRWRTVETVRDGTGADPKLDPSGELLDGRKFADAARPEAAAARRHRQIRRRLPEKLATYALRRGMTFRDRAELRKLAEQSKADDYKLATLIESLALSDLFRRR